MAEYNYEKVAMDACAEMEGHMCWPVDWFKEDLPLENKDGSALDSAVEKMVNQSTHMPRLLQNFAKEQTQEPLELPRPDPPAKLSVLVFSDSFGLCKGMFENAPEGRISQKKVVENCLSLTQEDVAKLFAESKKGWDLVVFAAGCDAPRSNAVPDVIEQSSAVSRLYFWLLAEAQRADNVKGIFVLVRGCFAEDKKTHSKAGLGITMGSTLFGMSNSARMELEGVPIQFCDTEYFVQEGDGNLYARLASELFRVNTFGHVDVRILNSGRYVQRRINSTPYEAAAKAFPMPPEGVIAISGGNGALGLVMGNWLLDKAAEQGVTGFSIQFLSRSMKISDQNLQQWQTIQSKAAKLDIPVEQARMDMSSQEGIDNFLRGVDGKLAGFIHSAGVLQDSMLMNLNWDKFETVFESKHYAALYLHDGLERFSNPLLRFLWLFSSTSVYGNMGQINYSGSNAFLDALTRHRNAKGRICMAVQWGAWGDVGMASTMSDAMRLRTMNSPMPYFTNPEGLAGLEKGLSTGLPYFSVFKFNPHVMLQTVQGADHPNMCHYRNFYCEVVPTPMAPTLDRHHLYTIFRMGRGPQSKNPNAVATCKQAYINPAVAKNEREWGEDFRQW